MQAILVWVIIISVKVYIILVSVGNNKHCNKNAYYFSNGYNN